MMKDALHVVHARAAGLDIHKMEITSTVRLCDGPGDPVCETKAFSALPEGLEALAAWLTSHGVAAAAMEGTGIYWRAPWDRLRDAGIEVQLLHAQHVKQLRGRKTDVEVRSLDRARPPSIEKLPQAFASGSIEKAIR